MLTDVDELVGIHTGSRRCRSIAPRERANRWRLCTRRIRALGIRDKPTAPASPWQNSFAERLIGSIRRECVDHFIVFGEAHLRRLLRTYARYYNDIRTHRSLDEDAPVSRPVQWVGSINSHAILGGLHHHYVRV
ncbi:MAG: integrase core domain-containing protein [Xanthobacteraceae bacterium]